MPLRATLEQIGLALGGRPGERLSQGLARPVSRMTLLRLVRGLPEPAVPTPRVLGVDEFAIRRGRNYATLLIDGESHRPIDVLEDRSADTLAAWLTAHASTEIICRDRAGVYAEGATRGAPQAVQVADRWHLLRNLSEAVERALVRLRRDLVEPGEDPPPSESAVDVGQSGPVGRLAARQRERHAEIHALLERGANLSTIARTLHLDRQTIRRSARMSSGPPETTAACSDRPSLLAPFADYLDRRWAEGCTDGARLFDELQAQGYRGSRRTLRRYLTALRRGCLPRQGPQRLAPRRVVWLILRRPERLDEEDRLLLEHLCGRSPELATLRDLARAFAAILRECRGTDLEGWLEEVTTGGIGELQSFAAGLRRDWAAILAGLTLPWSSGMVEGRVNRVKMLKRQMFGRAKTDLLRRRVLLAG